VFFGKFILYSFDIFKKLAINVFPCFIRSGLVIKVIMFADTLFSCLLGASACVELALYEEAIAWCVKGLVVSFFDLSQAMQVMQRETQTFLLLEFN